MILPGKLENTNQTGFWWWACRRNPELSTCAWRLYKQLNSTPENPTFKAFGSPGDFYGWLQIKTAWKLVEKAQTRKRNMKQISSNTLNLFPSRVSLLILYWCALNRCCIWNFLVGLWSNTEGALSIPILQQKSKTLRNMVSRTKYSTT